VLRSWRTYPVFFSNPWRAKHEPVQAHNENSLVGAVFWRTSLEQADAIRQQSAAHQSHVFGDVRNMGDIEWMFRTATSAVAINHLDGPAAAI